MIDRWKEIGMTPDEQEALSSRYSRQAIVILPLSSGNLAIYSDTSRKLCAIIPRPSGWQEILAAWTPPAVPKRPQVDLSELGLL
jgi:hypothetical protein